MSEEIKMSSFEIPKSVTHFMYESDEHRAHFLQVDEVGNVFAEFVPSVNYIGWDFDIEPYPLPVNAIPVSAYCEINRLAEENKRLREGLKSVTTRTHVDLIRCGIGANYSGENYENKLSEIWKPYIEAQKLLSETGGE